MPANLLPIALHSTFKEKVSNFPDNIYYFNDGDNLTTLMKILLGNGGTGQLNNLQIAARISQQHIEFSNLDTILGLIYDTKRIAPEIYSFSTNPFIDQLTDSQWQEVASKDAAYRERLLGAAEAFQMGATAWGVLTLCQSLTNTKFYVTESWRTPGLGRTGVNSAEEIVLIPLLDTVSGTGIFKWDQSYAQAIIQTLPTIMPMNFVISFGTPIKTFTQYPLSDVTINGTTPSGYSNYFFLQPTVNTTQVVSPAQIQPGSSTRYWVKNNSSTTAPFFAHLQAQETIIDQTGNISFAVSTDSSPNPSNSIANPSLSVTSTMYGGQ